MCEHTCSTMFMLCVYCATCMYVLQLSCASYVPEYVIINIVRL